MVITFAFFAAVIAGIITFTVRAQKMESSSRPLEDVKLAPIEWDTYDALNKKSPSP